MCDRRLHRPWRDRRGDAIYAQATNEADRAAAEIIGRRFDPRRTNRGISRDLRGMEAVKPPSNQKPQAVDLRFHESGGGDLNSRPLRPERRSGSLSTAWSEAIYPGQKPFSRVGPCRQMSSNTGVLWSVCGLRGDCYRTRELASAMSRLARRSAFLAFVRLTLLTP